MTRIQRVLDLEPAKSLKDHTAGGGGIGLMIARAQDQDAVIALIEKSGLRGRGGAGFPTGRKWRAISLSGAVAPTVVINAAEGEPGTFKDRAILRSNPYRVLEGACIAATALGSNRIVVAIKGSFVHEIERLDAAIVEIDAAG